MYAQGRCRICEKLYCCATHRDDHETKVHRNQLEIIKHFPVICKICHRMINTVQDLQSNCVVVGTSMYKHKLIRQTTKVVKRHRKRTIEQSISGLVMKKDSVECRKIIKPSIKYRKMKLARTLNTITNFHGQVSNAIIININTVQPIGNTNTTLSPEFALNTPEGNLLKNSTPLLKQSDASCETYHTPATHTETPLKGIIQSCKYADDEKYRKVTFDVKNDKQALPLVSMTSSCSAIEGSSSCNTTSYNTPLAITNNDDEQVPKNEMFSRFFTQMQSMIQGICNVIGFYKKNDSTKRLHSEIKSIEFENVCDVRDIISSPPNKKICIRPLNHSGRPLYTRSPLPKFLSRSKDK